MESQNKNVKLVLNSKEIDFLIVSLQRGRILDSGESEQDRGTFDNTYMDLESICVGKAPRVSFNFDFYTRKTSGKEPVWVDLNYKILSIEEVEIEIKDVYYAGKHND